MKVLFEEEEEALLADWVPERWAARRWVTVIRSFWGSSVSSMPKTVRSWEFVSARMALNWRPVPGGITMEKEEEEEDTSVIGALDGWV